MNTQTKTDGTLLSPPPCSAFDDEHHDMMNSAQIQQSVVPMLAALMDAVRFDKWWSNHGSAIRPATDEDQEEHAKRVAASAWIAAVLLPNAGLSHGDGSATPLHEKS